MAHPRKVRGIQVRREEFQLVDLQTQVASLYLRVVPHVERDDALNQRRKSFSVVSVFLHYSFIRLIIYLLETEKYISYIFFTKSHHNLKK